MQTINVINNIVLKDGILHAYGREGNVTRVFLRQGNLEGRCAVYSLMMLLILHGILNREDLLRKVSAKAPEYIKKLIFVEGITYKAIALFQQQDTYRCICYQKP